MIAMRVMQVAVHEVVDVVAVRHRFVPAARPMHMTGAMASAVMLRRAAVRVGCADGDYVLVDMVAMHVMEVAVMQEIDVAFVAHRGVTALRAVLVVVMGVLGATGHRRSPVVGCIRTIDRK